MDRSAGEKVWDPDTVFRFCPVCGAAGFSPREPELFLCPVGDGGTNDMVCRSCGFTLFINASLAVSAIITHPETGDILMTLRNRDPHKGTFSLPGGFVAPGERAENALAREVFEETGLRVIHATPVNRTYTNRYHYRGMAYFTTEIVYRCQCEEPDRAYDADPDEAELRWVPRAELTQVPIGLEPIKRIVSDYVIESLPQ